MNDYVMNDFSTYTKTLETTVTRIKHTVTILPEFKAWMVKKALANVPDVARVWGVYNGDDGDGKAELIFMQEVER